MAVDDFEPAWASTATERLVLRVRVRVLDHVESHERTRKRPGVRGRGLGCR